jgi:hypothetical protein
MGSLYVPIALAKASIDYCVAGPAAGSGPLQVPDDCFVRIVDTSASVGLWGIDPSTLATLIVGFLALLGVGATLWQRHRAERSDERWRRMSWAIDHASSGEKGRGMTGMRVLLQFITENGPSVDSLPAARRRGQRKRANSRYRLSTTDLRLCKDVAGSALAATRERWDQGGEARG